MLAVFLPRLQRIERILHHRIPWVSSHIGERVTGFMMVLVSLLLLLPIPFTNIPLGTILCLLGLGLLKKTAFFCWSRGRCRFYHSGYSWGPFFLVGRLSSSFCMNGARVVTCYPAEL